ncbi:hypothetical protein WN51_12668 [Melipona quadrifasciata]|uniref:Uncharacterized protein n=1 Tax=Melipona quadrifasciata TaxID=166423 RepID=A0A0N0BGL9_9HYME|nr:hypothetical protein WN51_12668 [Melipona quadrifasciata]
MTGKIIRPEEESCVNGIAFQRLRDEVNSDNSFWLPIELSRCWTLGYNATVKRPRQRCLLTENKKDGYHSTCFARSHIYAYTCTCS